MIVEVRLKNGTTLMHHSVESAKVTPSLPNILQIRDSRGGCFYNMTEVLYYRTKGEEV